MKIISIDIWGIRGVIKRTYLKETIHKEGVNGFHPRNQE